MFKKKVMIATIAGMSLMIGCSGLALASDGVYYDDDDDSNIIVIGGDTETELTTEEMTETETESETVGFTVNTDGFSYIDGGDEVETEGTANETLPATAQLIPLNVNTRIKEKAPETEVETETETETEAETEERTATLPKTGDFTILDEIFNGLQDVLWALR